MANRVPFGLRLMIKSLLDVKDQYCRIKLMWFFSASCADKNSDERMEGVRKWEYRQSPIIRGLFLHSLHFLLPIKGLVHMLVSEIDNKGRRCLLVKLSATRIYNHPPISCIVKWWQLPGAYNPHTRRIICLAGARGPFFSVIGPNCVRTKPVAKASAKVTAVLTN